MENKEKKEATDIFEAMERRLFFYIMRPAMILTWVFGLIFDVGFSIFEVSCISFSMIIITGILAKLSQIISPTHNQHRIT